MKRRDLMKKLEAAAKEAGESLDVTEGGDHTKVKYGEYASTVPRHNEINEITAKAILKQMGAN